MNKEVEVKENFNEWIKGGELHNYYQNTTEYNRQSPHEQEIKKADNSWLALSCIYNWLFNPHS